MFTIQWNIETQIWVQTYLVPPSYCYPIAVPPIFVLYCPLIYFT